MKHPATSFRRKSKFFGVKIESVIAVLSAGEDHIIVSLFDSSAGSD